MDSLSVCVPFHSRSGQVVSSINIAPSRGSDRKRIFVVSALEASAWGEETTQLIEGETYFYEVLDTGLSLQATSAVVSTSAIQSNGREFGTIEVGSNAGLLTLVLSSNGQATGYAYLEIRSSKLSYRHDYRLLLEAISRESVDLITRLGGKTDVRLNISNLSDSGSVKQRFLILKGLLDNEDLPNAFRQVLRYPHSRLLSTHSENSVHRLRRVDSSELHQFLTAQPRFTVIGGSNAARRIAPLRTVPQTLRQFEQVETLDTAENRFIKRALTDFVDVLTAVEVALRTNSVNGERFCRREVQPLRERLEEFHAAAMFHEVSDSNRVPYSSTILQRRAGYEEVFRSWMKVGLALGIDWGSLKDRVIAGQKSVPLLYEIWCFLVVWRTFCSVVGLPPVDSCSPFRDSDDGLGITLKTGHIFPDDGVDIRTGDLACRAQLSFNKTFTSSDMQIVKKRLSYLSNHDSAGSWSRSLRPDITISLWPPHQSLGAAEKAGSVRHLHFDAKYKISRVSDLFEGDDRSQTGDTLRAASSGDLMKMHAYRDAVRRSAGAYVLFPGELNDAGEDKLAYQVWLLTERTLPSIGAFSLRPSDAESVVVLERFLLDVVEEYCACLGGTSG
jgi:predicted component of viral defense system (DUF524 family)